MSRPLRIEYEGAWYHVMNRGRQSEPIFRTPDDYLMFIDILRESAELWDIRISAYCLMANHYHLLIQTPRGNLSRSMRHINGIYTQRFNRVHGLDGPLFRGRYKSLIVEGDSYLLQLVRYIHKNPLTAGVADNLNDYPWSSHKAYVSVRDKSDWLHRDFILSLFGSENSKGLTAYKNFMALEDSKSLSRWMEGKKWPLILADEYFLNRIKRDYYNKKTNSQVPESRLLAPELQSIKETICAYYGIDGSVLLKSRRGRFNEPRSMAIYLCRKLRKDGLLALGSEFGLSGYSSASSVVLGMKRQVTQNRDIKKRAEALEKMILTSQMET
jgi:putative transposase